MRSLTRMAALAGRAMAAKRGLVSRRSSAKLTGASGSNAARHVLQDHLGHALHQRALDGGVGPALDAHGRGAAAPAQKHVHDGIDEIGIHREQPVIVEFLGAEHRQDRGQRDRIQIIAEADGGDVVQAHFHIVGSEIAQGRRHQPHQPVEDDFQHRQALIGDQRRIDDGPDAGFVLHLVVVDVEAQEGVDLLLIQDALGGCAGARRSRGRRFAAFAFGVRALRRLLGCVRRPCCVLIRY